MPRNVVPVLALLLAIACLTHAQKEFADCGSTALMPLKLELDPDPAEVCARANLLAHSLPLGRVGVGRHPHKHAEQRTAAKRATPAALASCEPPLVPAPRNDVGCCRFRLAPEQICLKSNCG